MSPWGLKSERPIHFVPVPRATTSKSKNKQINHQSPLGVGSSIKKEMTFRRRRDEKRSQDCNFTPLRLPLLRQWLVLPQNLLRYFVSPALSIHVPSPRAFKSQREVDHRKSLTRQQNWVTHEIWILANQCSSTDTLIQMYRVRLLTGQISLTHLRTGGLWD